MRKGESIYYKVIKSLGKLKVCATNLSSITVSDFAMKITLRDESFAYGTHHYYQIELLNNGICNDIEVGEWMFSYLIENRTTWYSSYQEWHNWFTFEYINKNIEGKIEFDSCRDSDDGSILYNIIYALILISEINDTEKTLSIYNFLFLEKSFCGSLGQMIDLYKEIKNISVKIIEKYPFMEEVINKGLEERLQIIKKELLELALVENNLLD